MLLTDNKVLVENIRPLSTLICEQKAAEKVEIKGNSEEILIRSNINSFGDDIGKITNRITAMFDVQAQFEPDSAEYKELEYRIMCGQLLQQNSIDKAKGIISKPMPKEWYSRSANRITDGMSEEEKAKAEFNLRILADKKPYFMRYIYPDLMAEYNTYIKNTNKKCVREFRVTLEELLAKQEEELSEQEREFKLYYLSRSPVGINNCVVNRICRRVEEEFDRYFTKNESSQEFDYTILKSGRGYTKTQYNAVKSIYEDYHFKLKGFAIKNGVFPDGLVRDMFGRALLRKQMVLEFKKRCLYVCSNATQLCDIILDLCYLNDSTKQFCWDICADEIIENLLDKNNYTITYPEQDNYGEIKFCGMRFTAVTRRI